MTMPSDAERNQPIEPVATAMQSVVLKVVLDTSQQRQLTEDELVAHINDRRLTMDALAALQEVGLIQRRGEIIHATPAAVRFYQLVI